LRFPGVSAMFRYICPVLFAILHAESKYSGTTCDSSGSESCQIDVATKAPLHWRSKSYGKDQGLYGGDHVYAEFGKRFKGPVTNDSWDVLWTYNIDVANVVKQNLPPNPGRLLNHCSYFRAAGQKCYFAGHLRRVQRALDKRDNASSTKFVYLKNYVLNHEDQFEQWQREALSNPDRPWVVKECTAGMSAGIQLLRGDDLVKVAKGAKPNVWSVAQEYLAQPFLGFGNSKFHLRMYVLVTRWAPPSVFVYEEGVIFRSRKNYDPEHLSQDRDIFSMISPDVEAFPHASLWQTLDKLASDGKVKRSAAEVWSHIVEVIRAIFGEALEESFGNAFKKTHPTEVGFQCFDLFGLDVMLDEHLTPFVLEVNTGPNLNIDDRGEEASGLLHNVKGPLLRQLVHWAELYVRRAPLPDFEPTAIEELALTNFTRVL